MTDYLPYKTAKAFLDVSMETDVYLYELKSS